MKRIIRPGGVPPSTSAPEVTTGADLPEFDLQKLLAHGGEVLRREIASLMRESAQGKLNAGSARDLVAYIRLLQDIKNEQIEELNNLTDDELAAKIAKEGANK